MSKSVVIVGGGVIGAACAHFLLDSGWNVTVIDKGRFAGGCSHGNCGYVSPSHVLPLAEPGAIRGTLRMVLRRNSPFRIKPRLDLALWSWMANFARRCNHADMMEAGRGIKALLDSSMTLYRELIERHRLQCEWEHKGLLYVYQSAALLEAYSEIDHLLREAFGRPAVRYDGEDLNRFEPSLRPGLAGGWYYDCDAHMRADRLMASWRKNLESRGAVIREGCAFTAFAGGPSGAATAVETSSGAFSADAFVMATGAWTSTLARHLGCRVPIQPGKGYSMTMRRPEKCPTRPLIFPETRVAVTPMRSGYRLGSMMEFAGYDESLRPERIGLLKRGAEPYLLEPYTEQIEEQWYGWRPMTYDGKPIIGPCPEMKNVLIAAGHNMLGLSMAPATGRLVAEMLDDRPPHVDPAAYSATRFC
jgi:D-amino-acid dehydrogenase